MKTLKILLLAAFVILLCIFTPGGIPQMDTGTGRNVAVTGENMRDIIKIRIEKMQSLGITEADDRIEEAAAEAYSAYPLDVAEALEEMAEGMPQADGLIFYYIGAGEYDYDSWEWTPSSRQVYAFDMEVFNVSSMYTDFLHGVLALTGDDVLVTDIEEDCSGVDEELGTGMQTLRFRCNGNPYEFQAKAYYDWMDLEVIDFMNGVLEKEGAGKRLWAAYDGGQECILFYNTEEWAEEFQRTMGYGLLNSGT